MTAPRRPTAGACRSLDLHTPLLLKFDDRRGDGRNEAPSARHGESHGARRSGETPDKKAGVFAPREDTLLSDTRLCDTQAGFRKGWSTTDVLARLRSRLQEKNTAAVLVGLSRAFDPLSRVLNGHRHHPRCFKMT